jgi:hypothetical protein
MKESAQADSRGDVTFSGPDERAIDRGEELT